MGKDTDLGFNVYALDRASKTFLSLAGNVERLERKLDQLDRKRANPQVDVDTAKAQSQLAIFARRLDDTDSRMANLVQTSLALAPALVPLGAAAVPALAGLTTQLGLTVGAAGVTVLAFQGIGDALDALNDYQVDPTAENFEKLQQQLDTLGPAGQEFVLFLQELRPQLQDLQDVAEAGMLPGFEDGITDMMHLLPQAERVIGHVSTTIGSLVAEAGDNLDDPRWVEFFDFLDREANPTLTAMGKSAGNVVEGLANMIVAFDPLADDFTSGMLGMSRSFREWTEGLDDSETFHEFLNYVRESGPAAMDALGAIAGALVSLTAAAAPVGQVVLPIVEGLADGLSAVAESPAGPALISLAAAVGVVGRSLALLKAVGLRGGNSMLGRMFSGAVAPIKDATVALTTVTTAQDRARMSTAALAEVEKKHAATVRAGLAQLGKGAALVGAFAVAQSGLAEKSGLSNTASLALMGTIAGPWGAAIGGGIGLVMDLAAANNDLDDALRTVDTTASSMHVDFAAQRAALDGLRESTDAYIESANNARGGNALLGTVAPVTQLLHFGDTLKSVSDLWTHASEEAAQAQQEQTEAFMAMRQGAAEFYAALNDGDLSMLYATDEELTRFVTDIAPAMQRAGLDVREVLTTRAGWDEAVAAVTGYNAAMDSAHGRSEAVGDALADLGSQMETNATQADALKSAMDALFGTELNQAEAIDAWRSGLQELREQIAGTTGAIRGNSQAALANREQIRGSVEDLQARVAADAAAGVSGRKLAQTLLQGRDAIVDQAVAAGASKKAVSGYLDTLGLTPENLTTIIQTPGLLSSQQQIKALGRLYGLTPKQVTTLIHQPGINRSQAEIADLARQYDMTPKEVRTLLKAVDQASAVVAHVKSIYAGIDPVITTSIITNHVDKFIRTTQRAGGGLISGPGTATSDSIPARLSDGEYVVRAAAVDHYGPALFDGLNAMAFAAGGHVSRFAGGGRAGGGYTLDQRINMTSLEQEIRRLRRELAATGDDRLKGLDRVLAHLNLQATRRDLRQARREPARTTRAAAREFDLDGEALPKDVRAAFREFRRAGGVWNRDLERLSRQLVGVAEDAADQRHELEREAKQREKLVDALDQEKQALEELRSQMDSFGDAVARNFLNDPFGKGGTVTVDGPADPVLQAALTARQDQLAAASAHLGAIQGDASLDPLTRSQAVLQQLEVIKGLRADVEDAQRAVEASIEPVEKTVSGAQALWDSLTHDIDDATAFFAGLDTLAAKGLDTTGGLSGLYQGLSSSGDTATVTELAAMSPEAIDQYEKLFARRDELVAEGVADVQQATFGPLIEAQNKAIANQTELLNKHDETMKDTRKELRELTKALNSAKLRPVIGDVHLGRNVDIDTLLKKVGFQLSSGVLGG